MIKIAVIDDESKARETIINILKLSNSDFKIIGEAENIKSGVMLIEKESPDLLLLDISLTDGTGFDLLKKFNSIPFKIIFITAHEEYALQAIKFSAIDYILKPIVAGELLKAIDKAGQILHKEDIELKLNALFANLDKVKKIVLKTAESIHLVNVKAIIRCEADVNYTHFFLDNGEKLLVSKTLKEFAEMLEPAGFFRAHQSHLVNLDYVTRFDKTEGGHLVMADESIVPVSLRKREFLFDLFERM
ncbi:MAG: LytTR family DNA-binding domain-containing protein [Bacteroidales bacterium]